MDTEPADETVIKPPLHIETPSCGSPGQFPPDFPDPIYPDVQSILPDIETKFRSEIEDEQDKTEMNWEEAFEDLLPSPSDHPLVKLNTVEDCHQVINTLVGKLQQLSLL